jgi:glycosyltransferase involved in cell wall biosynthesis
MPRTVVHFTDSTGFGGAERSLLHLLAGQQRDNWSPLLVHHESPGIVPLLEEARASGVPTRSVPPMPPGLRGLRHMAALMRLLSDARPSVFHAHLTWPLACTYGLLSAALSRVPAIVATVQLFVDIPYGRWVRARQRVLSTRVGRYIAVSRALAGRLHQTFGIPRDKISVVHNGVPVLPLPRQHGSAEIGSSAPPVVLTTARLDPQKGLDDLLVAAALVPEARFVVAGDGPQRGHLVARAESLGLSDRVSFLGLRRDVPELLAGCDLFVLPSRYEGLPLAVLEAMAAGKPVVATAIAGTDEAVVPGLTGLLVPPGDGPALAAAIRAILGDPALAARLGKAGHERVERDLSAQTMVARVTRIYGELLIRPGRRHV